MIPPAFSRSVLGFPPRGTFLENLQKEPPKKRLIRCPKHLNWLRLMQRRSGWWSSSSLRPSLANLLRKLVLAACIWILVFQSWFKLHGRRSELQCRKVNQELCLSAQLHHHHDSVEQPSLLKTGPQSITTTYHHLLIRAQDTKAHLLEAKTPSQPRGGVPSLPRWLLTDCKDFTVFAANWNFVDQVVTNKPTVNQFVVVNLNFLFF